MAAPGAHIPAELLTHSLNPGAGAGVAPGMDWFLLAALVNLRFLTYPCTADLNLDLPLFLLYLLVVVWSVLCLRHGAKALPLLPPAVAGIFYLGSHGLTDLAGTPLYLGMLAAYTNLLNRSHYTPTIMLSQLFLVLGPTLVLAWLKLPYALCFGLLGAIWTLLGAGLSSRPKSTPALPNSVV